MPKIPTRTAPSERLNPLQGGEINQRYSADDFGAGIGKSISGAANQVGQAMVEKRDEMDAIRVQDSINELEQYRIENIDSQAANLKGKNAIGMGETLSAEYFKQFEAVKKSLSTPQQRDQFDKYYAANQTRVLGSYSKIENAETRRYQSEVLDASKQRYENELLTNSDDDNAIEQQRANMQGVIRKQSLLDGDGREEVALKLEQLDSDIGTKLVEQKLSVGDYEGAENVYARVGKSLLGKQKVAIDKAMIANGIKHKAQKISDDIIDKGLSSSEALAKIGDIKNPDVRSQARNNYFQNKADMKTLKTERQLALVENITAQINESGGDFNVNVTAYDELPPQTQKAIELFAANKRNGYAPQTDVHTYAALVDRLSDPNSFKDIPLINYVNKLSESDYKKFNQAQLDLRTNKATSKATKELKGVQSENQVAMNALAGVGIDTSAKAGKDEKKRVASFMEKLELAKYAYFQQNGKNPDPVAYRVMVNQLTAEVKFTDGWNVTKPLYEVQFEDIDENDVVYLRKTLKESSGTEPSEDQILSMFKNIKANEANK